MDIIYYNKVTKQYEEKQYVFSSKNNNINLGKDVDQIINSYLDDLNNVCTCNSCKIFSNVFEHYYRHKINL